MSARPSPFVGGGDDRIAVYAIFVDRMLSDGLLDAAAAELQHMGGAIMALPAGEALRSACESWLSLVVRLAEARNARRTWAVRCATTRGPRFGPLRVI